MWCLLSLLAHLCVGTIVNTEYGPVVGIADTQARSYVAIPYAAAPIDNLRFKPPVPPSPWTIPSNGLESRRQCPQPSVPVWSEGDPSKQSLDCLQLNVVTPLDATASSNLPVLVWIHGGAMVIGSAHHAFYNMSQIAGNQNIVAVSINYRLGVEAILAHPLLTAENASHPTSGAYALQDQQLALQWVQKNVANFGGDPSRVTIFGESAGGQSVVMHLLSPGSKGLFHRAVSSSGPVGGVYYSLAEAEKQRGKKLEDVHGPFRTADDIRKVSHDDMMKTLFPSLVSGEDTSSSDPEVRRYSLLYGPVADNIVLPSPFNFLSLFEEGRYNRGIPLAIGSMKNDWSIFGTRWMLSLSQDTLASIFQHTFKDTGAQLLAYYQKKHPDYSPFQILCLAFTQNTFTCPAFNLARSMTKHGDSVRIFDWQSVTKGSITERFGAHHAVDIYHWFGTASAWGGLKLNEEESLLAYRAQTLLAQFVKGEDEAGTEGDSGKIVWKEYGVGQEDNVLVFDRGEKLSIVPGLYQDDCSAVEESRKGRRDYYTVELYLPAGIEPAYARFLNVWVLGALGYWKWFLGGFIVIILLLLAVRCRKAEQPEKPKLE